MIYKLSILIIISHLFILSGYQQALGFSITSSSSSNVSLKRHKTQTVPEVENTCSHYHIISLKTRKRSTALQAEPSEKESGLILSSDLANSILTSAFASLKEEDKYDTVLTGLCAKILDVKTNIGSNPSSEDGDESGSAVVESNKEDIMKGPMDLMKEMNSRKIKASPRSISALVDVSAKSQSVTSMSNTLSLCIRNGGIQNYGSVVDTIKYIPPRASSSTTSDLPIVPSDDRLAEISSAITVSLVTVICLILSNSVGSGPMLNDFSNINNFPSLTSTAASLILYAIGITAIVDNGYDALNAFGKTVNMVSGGKVKVPALPERDNMPLGIGKGEISRTVIAGLTRLLNVDTERECRCEAAAFFAAYSLGLPCFAFRPNSLEAVVLIFESIQTNESNKETSNLDPLLSSPGILKVLIWMLAPVAAENMKYPQLISSDPNEATGLLKRLEKSCADRNIDLYDILPNLSEDKDLVLRWAYREAEGLILRNKKVCEELFERLAGGAATIGDCVAVLEGWE